MSLIHVENSDSKKISSAKMAVIDFYADWCGPCKVFGPTFEAASKEGEFKDISFFKVNVDQNEELSGKYNVMSIPTTVFLKNGEEVDRRVGLMSGDSFKKILKSL
ncbi:Thiol:disulfide interchange protein DsbD [uncultured archaeon]|nr:Thiol:disulfide interchange protein DsbD [uncultured archaeon]